MKNGGSFITADTGVMKTIVSETSQFSFGGESACSFGALSLARLVLEHKSGVTVPLFTSALTTATEHFSLYTQGITSMHCNAFEVLTSEFGPIFYPDLQVITFSDPEPLELIELLSKDKIVFPHVFLPLGDITIQPALLPEIAQLLIALDRLCCATVCVTMGYAFGICALGEEKFAVFDSHSKELKETSERGSYIAVIAGVAEAARFICECTLDSRQAILESIDPSDVAQIEAVTSLQLCLLRLKSF
jgi:hypothetical protein